MIQSLDALPQVHHCGTLRLGPLAQQSTCKQPDTVQAQSSADASISLQGWQMSCLVRSCRRSQHHSSEQSPCVPGQSETPDSADSTQHDVINSTNSQNQDAMCWTCCCCISAVEAWPSSSAFHGPVAATQAQTSHPANAVNHGTATKHKCDEPLRASTTTVTRTSQTCSQAASTKTSKAPEFPPPMLLVQHAAPQPPANYKYRLLPWLLSCLALATHRIRTTWR